MSSQMGFLARSLLVLASLAGACSPDQSSSPVSGSGVQMAPGTQRNSIYVAMLPVQMDFAGPVTLEWVDDRGVVSSRTISSATSVEIADTVTEVRAHVPPGYAIAGWSGPCAVGLNRPLNDFSVCELTSGPVHNQVFTVAVAPRSYQGWNLDFIHGPSTYSTQNALQNLTAAAIDHEGSVAVAGHYGGGHLPFVVQGRVNAPGLRSWEALYAALSIKGPFLPPVESLQLLGTAAQPTLTNCRAQALVQDTDQATKELVCISPSGETRIVGQFNPPTTTLVVANAATIPTVFTTSGAVIYSNSTPDLSPASWAQIDLKKSFTGLPPLSLMAGSIASSTPWYVGANGVYSVVVYPDRGGNWAIDYLSLQNDSLIDVQALVGGGAWLLSRQGQMFEKLPNGSYEDRTAKTCGFPVSLVAKESGRVWYAGTEGVCRWNTTNGSWERMFYGFGSFSPTQLVMSPDGRWLAAIMSNKLVATMNIK